MTRDSFGPLLNYLAVGGPLFGFGDWLLPRRHKLRLKDTVAKWWVYVDDIKWSGLAPEDARRVLEVLVWIFGRRHSRRLLIRAGVGGSVVVLAGSLLSIRLQAGGVFDYGWLLWLETALGGIGAAMALAVMMGLLQRLSATKQVARQLLVIAQSAVFTLLLGFTLNAAISIPIGFAGEILDDQYRDGDRVQHLSPAERSSLSPDELARYSQGRAEGNEAVLGTLTLLLFAVVYLPILCFLVFLVLMALSKVIRPILQPVTSLVLLRLCESEKGIVAQIGLAVGYLALLLKMLLGI